MHDGDQVRKDPYEYHELSAQFPEKVRELMRRVEELKESAFTPVRCTGCDDGFGNIACDPSGASVCVLRALSLSLCLCLSLSYHCEMKMPCVQ